MEEEKKVFKKEKQNTYLLNFDSQMKCYLLLGLASWQKYFLLVMFTSDCSTAFFPLRQAIVYTYFNHCSGNFIFLKTGIVLFIVKGAC